MSATTISSRSYTSERVNVRQLLWVAPLAGAIAALFNVVVRFVAVNLLQLPMLMPIDPTQPPQTLPIAAVVIFTLVPALGAGVLLALLGRFTQRPITLFTTIAVVFLLISFVPDLVMPFETATRIVLILMHIIAGVVITGALVKWGREV